MTSIKFLEKIITENDINVDTVINFVNSIIKRSDRFQIIKRVESVVCGVLEQNIKDLHSKKRKQDVWHARAIITVLCKVNDLSSNTDASDYFSITPAMCHYYRNCIFGKIRGKYKLKAKYEKIINLPEIRSIINPMI